MKPKYSIGENIYWLNVDEEDVSIKFDKITAVHIYENIVIYDTHIRQNLNERRVRSSAEAVAQILVDNFYNNLK